MTAGAPLPLHATDPSERIESLDILRGAALLGVLLVNLTTIFRVSLLQHITVFHTHPGVANKAVDLLVGVLLESKAFTLFSLLFGAGLALQARRVEARGVPPLRLLVRRLLALLVIGLVHLVLIWNGDILALYAVVALVLLPTLWWSDAGVLLLAVGLLLWHALDLPRPWPAVQYGAIGDLVPAARRAYATGTVGEIVLFRQEETRRLILPLLGGVAFRTAGVMLLGQYLVRRRVLQGPREHRRVLRGVAWVGIVVGLAVNVVQVVAAYDHVNLGALGQPVDTLGVILPALGCGALGLLALQRPGVRRVLSPLGAVGRMALTCYLTQSLVWSLVFYRLGGWGLGLFGRLGAATVLPLGLALYVLQVMGCRRWLRVYVAGPVEWLWRSLTYGAAQPMRRGAQDGDRG